MSRVVGPLRSVAAIVLTWGAVWVATVLVIGLVVKIVDPASIDPGEGPLVMITTFGGVGLAAGALFAALLLVVERGRPILDLRPLRAALWGALAAVPWPFVTTAHDNMLVILCPLGALSGVASIALARAAEHRRVERA
jgi:hypothetical protein